MSEPSTKHFYDALDQQLISLLRTDGRASLAVLAKQLGVSRGTVQNRLTRLLSSGALLGFTVRVREDYEVVGKSTAQVIRALRGIPQLVTLHTTNGSWDLVAEVRADNLAEFDRVLREVRVIDGVLNSETNLLLSSV